MIIKNRLVKLQNDTGSRSRIKSLVFLYLELQEKFYFVDKLFNNILIIGIKN